MIVRDFNNYPEAWAAFREAVLDNNFPPEALRVAEQFFRGGYVAGADAYDRVGRQCVEGLMEACNESGDSSEDS